MEFDCRIVKELDPAAVLGLYTQAGWWAPEDVPEAVPKMLEGSLLLAGAFCCGRLIGFGRALSDGVSDAYIQDIVVALPFRRQGAGRGIVRVLTEELLRRGISWIGLVGVPGTEKFYQSLGFRPMEGHTPMLFDIHGDGQ